MTNLPVLTIYMAPSEDCGQSYSLRLGLSEESISDVLNIAQNNALNTPDTAVKFEFPFSLDLLPHIQRILNAIQSTKRPPNQPFKDNSNIEKDLMDFGLLDRSGNILYSEVLNRVGEKIGDALLNTPIFKEYLQRFYESTRATKGGDIVFNFDTKVLELAALPWELASDGKQPILVHPNGGDILLSCTRVILDRHQTQQYARNTRLRVLEVASYAGMDGPARELEQEARRRLEESLSSIQHKEFDRSLHGLVSLEELGKLLDKRADILDYYGHGYFDKDGCAMLSMYDDNGTVVNIPTVKLIALPNLPPLIVFHVCHSAQIDIQNVESSLAPVLSNHDSIEAIVAMQCEIQMRIVAHQITPVLYEALATHESLPRAVARVRQKLFTQNVDAVSWFVPVLYMRKFSQDPYIPLKQLLTPPNPFLVQRAVDDARFFLGRQRQVQEMWKMLSYKRSLLITGKSGCGKTSMLRRIIDEKNISDKLRFDREIKVVWLLLQIGMKAKEIEDNVVQEIGGIKGEKLQRVLEEKHLHLILLLDDLGVLDQLRKAADFLLWLKNVLSLGVQLVVTNEESLKGSFARLSKQHSLLATQISIEMDLKPFTREEARSFIIARLKGTGFKVDQFEEQLKDNITPGEVENACWKKYDELCEPSP